MNSSRIGSLACVIFVTANLMLIWYSELSHEMLCYSELGLRCYVIDNRMMKNDNKNLMVPRIG